MLAAWQEVSTTEDLTSELDQLEPDECQQHIYAAVEHAAAGLGRRPHEWPEHLEAIQQRQFIHDQCHYVLRGAVLDDYATLEEEDETGKHVELYLGPEVSSAFFSTQEVSETMVLPPRGHLRLTLTLSRKPQ